MQTLYIQSETIDKMRKNEIYRCIYCVVLITGIAILGLIYYSEQKNKKPDDFSYSNLNFTQIRAELKATFPNLPTEMTINDMKKAIAAYMKERGELNTASDIGADIDTYEKELKEKSEDGAQYTSKKQTEQILRDSVDIHHKKNFIAPINENCKHRLPGCIILGVAKSGTRELMDFMRLHPHIELSWRSASYENPYFGSKYFKGKEWFKNEMPCSYSNQITVMKNAWYFHNPYVPKRIQEMNETVKLIVIVREPVSRAISQYSFFHRNAKTYEDGVLKKDDINVNIPSLRLSIYDQPMERWLQYFKREQFLILDSSELKTNPAKAVRKVEQFLGLGHYVTPDMFVLNKEKGFYCIQSDLTTNGMACYAQDRGRAPMSTSPRTFKRLQRYFKPHNEKFFNLIGKSFDWGY